MQVSKQKTVLVIAVTFFVGLVIGFVSREPEYVVTYRPYYTSTYHTEKSENWQLLEHKDDTAYYIVSSNMTQYIPNFNEKVYYWNDTEAIVTDVSPAGFVIRVEDDVDVYNGLSGTPVCSEHGMVYGYISASLGKGNVFCIWR